MLLSLILIFCGCLLSPDPTVSFMSFEGWINSPFAHYNAPTQFVTQKVSHFNGSEKRQWKQYFYSNTNNSRDANLNFLIMGGEWNIELSDVQDGRNMIMKWARHFGASVYSLGHRFYGKSQPLGNLKVESLKYLTVEEAIADAALFIETINSQKNLTHPKWVVFGMSYPGALAVWFRQKYPDLTVGCVASSPPVRAVVDNDYLFKIVENDLNKYGPENCTSNIRRYFSKYQSLLATEQGRRKIGYCLLKIIQSPT
ncbi:serine carboxypeptidase s28 domain-containing protein [Ditylenchus destructor]|uniref:Serine carboxypeptidase s28 domain-containing protein n=1 Tax=Ditylenchus destructor TaxID=166010 RepID=A0AAD4MYB4_9BILA|nr:serine carboxypeptidase s28 domain-containing protein [Ditylenchus destructor]